MSSQPRVASSPQEAITEPIVNSALGAPKMPSSPLDLVEGLRMSPQMGVAVTSGVAAVLLLILAAELVLPPSISVSAFVFIPVLAAASLLPLRLAGPVVAVAASIRLIAELEGGGHALTAAAEILMVLTIGTVTLLAADRFRRWRAAQADLVKATARLAAAAEQERIAHRLTDDLTRNLFATTLDLQSAMHWIEDESARGRIATALGRLDAQITDLRYVVFARTDDQAADASR